MITQNDAQFTISAIENTIFAKVIPILPLVMNSMIPIKGKITSIKQFFKTFTLLKSGQLNYLD